MVYPIVFVTSIPWFQMYQYQSKLDIAANCNNRYSKNICVYFLSSTIKLYIFDILSPLSTWIKTISYTLSWINLIPFLLPSHLCHCKLSLRKIYEGSCWLIDELQWLWWQRIRFYEANQKAFYYLPTSSCIVKRSSMCYANLQVYKYFRRCLWYQIHIIFISFAALLL